MNKNVYSFENPYRATAYGKPSCRDTRIHTAFTRHHLDAKPYFGVWYLRLLCLV
jgi:hypothetical protein